MAATSDLESKDEALKNWSELTDKMTFEEDLSTVQAEQLSPDDLDVINKPQDSLMADERVYAEKLRACISTNVDKLPIYMVTLVFLCIQTIDEPVYAVSEDEAIEQFWDDNESIDSSGIYDGFFFEDKEFKQSDFIFEARVVEAHVTASEEI